MLKTPKEKCCGCFACAVVCPVSIIEKCVDEKGFAYPKIKEQNAKKCIQCNACNQICIAYRVINHDIHCNRVYAAKSKEYRQYSQSGGAFGTFARYTIENGGIAYGAAHDGKNSKVRYKRASTKAELFEMYGSKYVQSDIGNIFSSMKIDLIKGKNVLFCGTPCYIDAARKLFSHKEKNLLLVDFICHGVASPSVFAKYLEIIERNFSSFTHFNFRDKNATGWHGHKESFITNGKKIVSSNYANIYYSHNAFRDKCYSCSYTNQDRVGDITIGDFWGIEKSSPNFDDNKGCSIIIINTDKGENFWNIIKNKFDYISEDIQNGLQPTLQIPVKKPYEAEYFWSEYLKNHEKALIKYCSYNPEDYMAYETYILKRIIASFIGKLLPRNIKNFIKNFLQNLKQKRAVNSVL